MVEGRSYKQIESMFTIDEKFDLHLRNNPNCLKHIVTGLAKGRPLYHLSVLKILFIKYNELNICEQQ